MCTEWGEIQRRKRVNKELIENRERRTRALEELEENEGRKERLMRMRGGSEEVGRRE